MNELPDSNCDLGSDQWTAGFLLRQEAGHLHPHLLHAIASVPLNSFWLNLTRSREQEGHVDCLYMSGSVVAPVGRGSPEGQGQL